MIRTIAAVAVSALCLAGLPSAAAQAAARCPPGQIWRVSKKVCQPKSENMHLFGGKSAKPKAAPRAETPPAQPARAEAPPAVEPSRASIDPEPSAAPEPVQVDREPVGTIRPRREGGDAPVAALAPTPAPRPDDLPAVAAPAPEAEPEPAVARAEPPAEPARPVRALPPIVQTGLYGDEQRVYRLVKAVSLPAEDLGHSLSPGEILPDAVQLRPLPEGVDRELAIFRELRLQYVFADGAVALVLPASRMVLRVIADEASDTSPASGH